MIKGNVIEFGYGDVLVCADQIKGCITITNINSILNCGEIVKDINLLSYGEKIEIYEDNLHDIFNLMCEVSEENRIVKYNGWTFDFSNYNDESVRVVIDKAFNIVNIFPLLC